MNRVNSALVVALVLLLAGTANAQTAEDLYTQGQEAYDRKNYDEAIERWRSSYQMSNEEALFFNIAQAQRLSGKCSDAIESYQRYTTSDRDPASEQHKLAEDFTRRLEAVCPLPPPRSNEAQKLPLQPAERRSAEGTTRPGRTLKISGAIVGGAALLTLATGLYLGHQGQAIGDEVTAACRVSCDWSAWKDRDAKGQRYVSIGRGLDVGGAIGIAGGAALYYLGVRQGALTITPRASEGGVAVSWSGSW